MPVHTLDASSYTSIRRAIVDSQSTNALASLKTRAPFAYGSYYRPFYLANLTQDGVTNREIIYQPVAITVNFTLSGLPWNTDDEYVRYTLPYPTKSLSITYTNMKADSQVPKIESNIFDFGEDKSQLTIDDTDRTERYNSTFLLNYSVDLNTFKIDNGDIVTLTTKSPISGELYIGYF
jgi:hypothetical protein